MNIDALYAGFVSSLPEKLRPVARALPDHLELTPAPGRSWDESFSHAVTLQAPRLVADALPHAEADKVRAATFAHALAVVEALGRDRVAEKQGRVAPELATVLNELRRARHGVLERLWPGALELATRADRETDEAIREEHALLRRLSAVSFDDYRRISLAKQAVGFPASLALAHAAGATAGQIELIRRALAAVALAIQFEDDAGDWEDDWRRGGGSWAVSLARRRLESVREQSASERPTEPDLVRRRVHRMRVLYWLLRGSRHQYRAAWRYGRALGADSLAGWAERQLQRLDGLLPLESRHAGYIVRARKLAPWAAEVLT